MNSILSFKLFVFFLCLPFLLVAQKSYIEVETKISRRILADTLVYVMEFHIGSDEILMDTEDEGFGGDDWGSDNENSSDPNNNEQTDGKQQKNDSNIQLSQDAASRLPDLDPEKLDVLVLLAQTLEVDISAFKVYEGLPGLQYNPLEDRFLVWIAVPGSQRDRFKRILDGSSNLQISFWEIIEAKISPAGYLQIEQDLLQEALLQAQKNAAFIAKTQNKKLGTLISLTKHLTGQNLHLKINPEAKIPDNFAETPLSAGEIEVDVHISVKFEL